MSLFFVGSSLSFRSHIQSTTSLAMLTGVGLDVFHYVHAVIEGKVCTQAEADFARDVLIRNLFNASRGKARDFYAGSSLYKKVTRSNKSSAEVCIEPSSPVVHAMLPMTLHPIRVPISLVPRVVKELEMSWVTTLKFADAWEVS